MASPVSGLLDIESLDRPKSKRFSNALISFSPAPEKPSGGWMRCAAE